MSAGPRPALPAQRPAAACRGSGSCPARAMLHFPPQPAKSPAPPPCAATPPPPFPPCRLPDGGEDLELDLRERMPWRRQYAILVA